MRDKIDNGEKFQVYYRDPIEGACEFHRVRRLFKRSIGILGEGEGSIYPSRIEDWFVTDSKRLMVNRWVHLVEGEYSCEIHCEIIIKPI